jgi:hypothetical protein
VPAFKNDFGCGDVLIGGVPALKKIRLDPAGEFVVFSLAEPINALSTLAPPVTAGLAATPEDFPWSSAKPIANRPHVDNLLHI